MEPDHSLPNPSDLAPWERGYKQEKAHYPAGSEGLELEARRRQRLHTGALLQVGRTPLQVIAVAESAATLAEDFIHFAARQQPPRPPLPCREGCAWCCHKLVGTTVPEVLRLTAFLRRQLSAAEFDVAREQVIRRDEERRALKQNRWAAARLPCSLLVNERCTAYPVRPLTCRGFNSRDARRCEQTVTTHEPVQVPMHAPQQRLATFVLDGMRAGLGEAGLKNELLELTAGLRIALTVPDAAQRWLAGEAVFAPAKFP